MSREASARTLLGDSGNTGLGNKTATTASDDPPGIRPAPDDNSVLRVLAVFFCPDTRRDAAPTLPTPFLAATARGGHL